MSVWVTLLSFSVSMTGVLFGWWGVWVLSVGGVWGVGLGVYESGWWGVCSEEIQPHALNYRAWWVGGLVGWWV